MIYFAEKERGGPIKIGYTHIPSVRFAELARRLGSVTILAVMDGGRPEEMALHRQFAHLRRGTAANAEWFDPGVDLLEFILREGREMAEGDRSWSIRLELTPEDRDDLRVMAAEAGMSMAALARKVVVEAIRRPAHL